MDLDRVPVLELLLTDGTLELRLDTALVLDVALQVAARCVLAAAAFTVVLAGRRGVHARPQHRRQGEAAHQAGHGAGHGAEARTETGAGRRRRRRRSARHHLLVPALLEQAAEQGLLQVGVCNITGTQMMYDM